MLNKSQTKPSEFSASCDAVRLGFALLNTVECLEQEDPGRDVRENRRTAEWETEKMMDNSQHSPPMYPTGDISASQQPKLTQMTDLSNCTNPAVNSMPNPTTTPTNTNNNNNSSNNNMNTNNPPTNNNMANPLRIKHFVEHSDRELAELATQEISLDLQGLIDETHFPDDNLFGDLMETTKKNEAIYGMALARGATPSSSGQNSPGSEGQNSPPAYSHHPYPRNTLAYLPGSVHNGAHYAQHHSHHPQVKQEPVDQEFSNSCSQAPSSSTGSSNQYNNNNNNNYSNSNNNNNAVSSSTNQPQDQMSPVLPFSLGGPLPSLKSFAQQPKYALGSSKKNKNPNDRSSDEYRRRRERNNIAVRKSREKAKLRTRETEDRVKILARENERLQKKVELLQEELSVLRSLFSSVGVLPDHIHRELAKHLDNFQAQHAAINY